MAVVRRVYLYGIAFVALWMLIGGTADLVALALSSLAQLSAPPAATLGTASLRDRLSWSIAVLALGLAGWLSHWLLAERLLRRGGDAERGSAIRRLFLYAVLFVGGLVITFSLQGAVTDLLRLAFGLEGVSGIIAGDLVRPLAWGLLTGCAWLYYARVARSDRALVPEVGAGATLRRWCIYGLSFVGLFLWLFGAVNLVQTLWQAFVVPPSAVVAGRDWLATGIASAAGSLIAGIALWALAWRESNRWLARTNDPDPETRSVLRKVYLYLVLAVTIAWSVWNAGGILYRLLQIGLLPARATSEPGGILTPLGGALAAALLFGLAWLYHARVLRQEAARAPELREQAFIRRFYGYLVALIGAVVFAVGLAGTLATPLDALAQAGAARPADWWQDRISFSLTLLIVGLPVWLIPWTGLQREAAAPATGAAARATFVRRLYLFIALGLSVLTLLWRGATALYQLLRLVLGERWTGGQTTELIEAAAYGAVAALFLIYHLRVLRGDAGAAALDAPDAAAPAPAVTVAIFRSADTAQLAELRQQLAASVLPGVQVQLLEVDAGTADRLVRHARPKPDPQPVGSPGTAPSPTESPI